MKRVLGLLLLILLAAGCGTYIQSNATATETPAPSGQDAGAQPPPATGKCQSKLTGRVLDANGAIAKGATINIKVGGKTFSTISDDNGLYGFAGLCAGTYTFAVSLQGQPAKDVAQTTALDGTNTGRVDLSVK